MNLKEAAQQAFEALDQINSPLSFREVSRVGAALSALRAALADTQDWDEIEVLRESLREHMAEIHRLRAAGRQALGALQFCSPLIEDYGDEEQLAIRHKALAGLTEYAMQRLADEQQMIERGTKAWADVPDATAWVDEMRGNVPAPTSQESRQVEPVGYGVFEDGNLHDSFRLEHEAKLFAALKGEHAEVGALYRSPPNQSEDTLGMVEPVAWMCSDETMCRSGYERFSRVCEGPWNIPVYTAPTKRKPLTDEEIKRLYDSLPSKYTLAMFARAVERAHGIGGEE